MTKTDEGDHVDRMPSNPIRLWKESTKRGRESEARLYPGEKDPEDVETVSIAEGNYISKGRERERPKHKEHQLPLKIRSGERNCPNGSSAGESPTQEERLGGLFRGGDQ